MFIISYTVKDPVDYQGRSFLHIPQDVGVNLKSSAPPDRCFLPKAHIHTWQGHTKGISAIRWFPRSAHLLMSCSMDCRVKVSKLIICSYFFQVKKYFSLLGMFKMYYKIFLAVGCVQGQKMHSHLYRSHTSS